MQYITFSIIGCEKALEGRKDYEAEELIYAIDRFELPARIPAVKAGVIKKAGYDDLGNGSGGGWSSGRRL
jgi:hypothetical protein